MCSEASHVPPILPFMAKGIRCQGPVGFLLHQHNRVENARYSTRGKNGRKNDAIRGREIIGKNGR